MELSVATFNLRNTTDRYDERKQLLLDTLADVDFHVCGLQEVRFEPSACHGLMDQVGELISAHPNHLSAYRAPLHTPYLSSDDKFRIDGNCILVNADKVDVISHSALELSTARTAHRIVFQLKGEAPSKICSYTNVHLHHQLEAVDENIRLDQITRTLAWIDALDKEQRVAISFLGGDFNAPPHEKAYSCILQSHFRSLYSQFHGSEPALTFPTGDPLLYCCRHCGYYVLFLAQG